MGFQGKHYRNKAQKETFQYRVIKKESTDCITQCHQ